MAGQIYRLPDLATGDIPVSRFTDLYVEGGRVYTVGMHGEIGNSLYQPEEKGRLTCAPLVRVYDKNTGGILHTGSYRQRWKNTEFLRLERAEDASLRVLGGPGGGDGGGIHLPGRRNSPYRGEGPVPGRVAAQRRRLLSGDGRQTSCCFACPAAAQTLRRVW